MSLNCIAYTIGNKENYDRWLKECEKRKDILMKMGKTEKYEGGTVWRTLNQVYAYLERNQNKFEYTPEIYGVSLLLGWDNDVSSEPNEDGFYYLLVDRPIFRL